MEPVRFPQKEAQATHADAPLDCKANPFSSSAPGTWFGRSLQTAFGDVIRHIALQTPYVVVAGAAGMGKTLLAEMIARTCSDMGMSVRRAESGRLLEPMLAVSSDVLLVDEADSMPSAVLQKCLAGPANMIAATIVFLCLPAAVTRFSFSGRNAAVLEIDGLTPSDAQAYLRERGNSIGRFNLFAAEAMDMLIDASRGVPRLLRSSASLAYFTAASERAAQIQCAHVDSALRMRAEFGQAKDAPSPTASTAVVGDVQVENTAPEPAAIIPKSETAVATSPAQLVSLADEVRRPKATYRSIVPVRLGLRGVALGAGLLISGIVGMSLFSAWERPRAEPYAPKVSVAQRAAAEQGAMPADGPVAGELRKPTRPSSQPPFRTPTGLARGNVPPELIRPGKSAVQTAVR